MDSEQRAQVRLILEDRADRSRIEYYNRAKALVASNAAKGQLQSGATIKAALRIMEELSGELVKETTDQVISVCREPEAYSLIHETLKSFQDHLRGQLDVVVGLATGQPRKELSGTAHLEAKRLFAEFETRSSRQLELHRFSFVQPTASRFIAQSHQQPKNSGGRPLARHWDEMWASMAVMLYVGDLKPNTQADLERAMKDWFSERDMEVGDTPVRERARTLWRLLRAAE